MTPDPVADPLDRFAGVEAARQRAGLAVSAHRPWPLPERPWVMGQTWERLLFAHWAVPPAALAALVPPPLALDTFGGDAWIGVTPFVVRNLRPRGVPPLPWLSTFPETNVRTYVTYGDQPGILFFTLEAARLPGVLGARAGYLLPYHWARMRVRIVGGDVHYRSRRRPGTPARLAATYRPIGPVFHAAGGSLEHFLAERYCLYAPTRLGLLRTQIHHAPWPLQPAAAAVEHADLLPVPVDGPPLVHYADRQDVLVWAPERADR